MNLGSVGIVLKITFHVSHDSTKIQKLLGTLLKQTTISESSGISFCRTCNRKNSQAKSGLECVQCKFVFHKKFQKTLMSIPLFAIFVIRKRSFLQK